MHARRLAEKIHHPFLPAHITQIAHQLPHDFKVIRISRQILLQHGDGFVFLLIALEKHRRQDVRTNGFRRVAPFAQCRLSHIVVLNGHPKIGELLAEIAVSWLLVENTPDQFDLSMSVFVLPG